MRPFLLCVLILPLLAQAEPVVKAPPANGAAAPANLPLRARLDRDTIRAAIAAMPAEPDPYPRRHEADTMGATPRENFAKEFASARLPDCLHSEG